MFSSELNGKNAFCNKCDQKFKTNDDLARHYLTHTREYCRKNATSENHTCKNIFLSKEELKDHITNIKCQSDNDKKINHIELSEVLCQQSDNSISMSATKVGDSEEVLVITPENCNITNVYIFTDDSESITDENILQSIDIDTIEQANCSEITVFVIPPGSSFESRITETDLDKDKTCGNENDDSCLSLSSDVVSRPNISNSIEKQIAITKTKPNFKKQHLLNSPHNDQDSPPSEVDVSKPRVFKCMDCGKCYNHRLSLKSHQRNKHGSKKPYECFICEKAFALRKYLRKHIFTHSEEKPYQCKSCLKGFIRKDEFEIHMMIHRGETPPSKCEHCERVCFSMSNLRNHILRHHKNPDSYKHNCTVCNKKFAANYLLQRHMKTHSKPTNNFSCESCGLGFKSHKTLQLHMNSHTDVKFKEC